MEEGAQESSRARRPHLTWLILVHPGPSQPFFVSPPAGCLVVLMGACPQRPAPPRPAAVVSPALFPLRIRLLQASGGGRPGRACLSTEDAAPARAPQSPAGHPQCLSQDHTGGHWTALQCRVQGGPERRGRVLLGGWGEASAFSLQHGLLTLSYPPPWSPWGPRHSDGHAAGAALSGHILDLGGPLIRPGGLGRYIWFLITQRFGRRPSMNSASAPPTLQ